MYYKVEAYTASERAGAILYAHNITPTYVSDNPVLNSQHVVFEAAKAYGHGLPYHAALASVTSASAELLGLEDRIGKIKEGFDADIVVWDSDPLSVGATPVQVWIDGAKQFKDPIVLKKPASEPITSSAELTKELEMKETNGNVVFTRLNFAYLDGAIRSVGPESSFTAIFSNGELTCIGPCIEEGVAAKAAGAPTIKLKDGHLTPPFAAFGTSLGLIEIDAEGDTHDGPPPSDGVSRAVDGLVFGGEQLARAFEHGVTIAISAPSTGSIDAKGISAGFHTTAKHKLERAAVWQEEVGLHYVFTLAAKGDKTPSISSAIAALRNKLLDAVDESNKTESSALSKAQYEEKSYLQRVISGSLPLILSVHSADTIATIISLKSEIESAIAKSTTSASPAKLRLVLVGGAEAHILANELAEANIAVVLAPLLPHAQSWDQKRSLTGAPITNGTTINYLLDAGVLVGISTEEVWETRDLGLLAGIAFANSEGRLSFKQALDLVGRNFITILGIEDAKDEDKKGDWVIWEGSPLEIGGRVRGMVSNGKTFVWE